MKNRKKQTQPPTVRSAAAEYLTYIASVGNEPQNIEIRYEDENIWLTQRMMALLYDVETNTINYHIKKVFEDSELQEEATIRKFRIVQSEGGRTIEREVKHYNLQMIIAVGFKVNSERAVQFRKWVNGIASTYTIKGWVMDDERLKRGTFLMNSWNGFVKSVPANANSIRKSPTFMRLPSIMTVLRLRPNVSMQRFKIKCTLLFTVILRRN